MTCTVERLLRLRLFRSMSSHIWITTSVLHSNYFYLLISNPLLNKWLFRWKIYRRWQTLLMLRYVNCCYCRFSHLYALLSFFTKIYLQFYSTSLLTLITFKLQWQTTIHKRTVLSYIDLIRRMCQYQLKTHASAPQWKKLALFI